MMAILRVETVVIATARLKMDMAAQVLLQLAAPSVEMESSYLAKKHATMEIPRKMTAAAQLALPRVAGHARDLHQHAKQPAAIQ